MNQIRIIVGPEPQRGLVDVEPYRDPTQKNRRLRPDEAKRLIDVGWAVPVREAEPERAVAAPAVERAVRPAAKRKAKRPKK